MGLFTVANLALRFALELAALAALAVFGADATSDRAANVALAIAAPLAAAAVWGIWSAPRAPKRLHGSALTALELALLLVSAGALAAAGHPVLAIALVALALANGAILARVSAEPGSSTRPRRPGSHARRG